jgi:hypothetical protein
MLYLVVSLADAQTVVPTSAPRIVVGLGLKLGAPVSFGARSANLTRPNGTPFALFRTENSLGLEPGLDASLRVAVTARWALEVTAGWARPSLRTRVTADAEEADIVTLRDAVSRFTFEGGASWRVAGDGRRRAWLVRVAAGHSRGLTAERVLLTSGAVASIGAAYEYWWPRAGRKGLSGVGLSVDARTVVRRRGLVLDDGRVHAVPAVGAGVIAGF